MTLVDQEPRGGWVVVGACFAALAVIFGVSYSFAAFFESYAREFAASVRGPKSRTHSARRAAIDSRNASRNSFDSPGPNSRDRSEGRASQIARSPPKRR